MSDKKDDSNSFATGLAGVIFGAAATVATIALSDKKNRQKAEKVLKDMGKKGSEIFKEISRIAVDIRNTNQKTLPKLKAPSSKNEVVKTSKKSINKKRS